MLDSKLINIYRIDGEINSTIIETTTGFYKISGSGFFKTDNNALKDHKKIKYVETYDLIIKEVKSSMEFTIIKLSNGDFIVHHVDTPFITIEYSDKIKEDKEFLSWYENYLQPLTNEHHYAILKEDSTADENK